MSEVYDYRADPKDVAIAAMRDADNYVAAQEWLAPYMIDLIEEHGLTIVWARDRPT